MKINILGTSYTIKECSADEDSFLKDCDGYCDKTSKVICITTKKTVHDDDIFEVYRNKILRHEIIHAFMNESGLQENFEHPKRYGHDETTVDWFAIQFPKLMAAFREAGCLEQEPEPEGR